jgi:two-component system cell cycle sensor histidine kinase PleC
VSQATAIAPASDEQAARLALDELRLALGNTRPNKFMIPCLAALICVMFLHWETPATLATWFAIVVVGLVPMQIVAAAFLKREPPPSEMEAWRTRIVIANAFFTICWSSMAPLFWIHGDSFNQVLVILVLACTLAGDTALMSASRPLSGTGSIVYGTAIVALPLHEGGSIYNTLALVALCYMLYMYYLSQQVHKTARSMLELRYDKNDLIEALERSKQDSDLARVRAEAASRSKSEFLANMSHELRTPLNAIIGFSEMIHSGGFAHKSEEYSKLIRDSGQHLLTLINDILDLAKIEAGRMNLHETDLEPGEIVSDCIKLMAGRAQSGSITLNSDVPAACPHLRADERALKQILLNLISNAVKFTPPGGNVTVGVYPQADGSLAIAVSDDGMGIAECDQARVFENFGQGRHDVVTSDKGTGLGLPIVKGLIEAHGGSVTLESAVGKGTQVTLHFPASRVLALARPRNIFVTTGL